MSHPLPLAPGAALIDRVPMTLFAGAAVALSALVFVLAERRWRERWRTVPLDHHTVTTGPYRSAAVVARHFGRAPALVRIAAASSFGFGQLSLPALVLALAVMPFDGIAIALSPGILVAVAAWSNGLLLLRRSPSVTRSARSAALASIIASVGLLLLCAVHAGYVEYDPNYGIREASNSVPAVAFVFALAATLHAALVLATIRIHRRALEWHPRSVDPAGEVAPVRLAASRRRVGEDDQREDRGLGERGVREVEEVEEGVGVGVAVAAGRETEA
jgi:hypothetical protein